MYSTDGELRSIGKDAEPEYGVVSSCCVGQWSRWSDFLCCQLSCSLPPMVLCSPSPGLEINFVLSWSERRRGNWRKSRRRCTNLSHLLREEQSREELKVAAVLMSR